MRVVMFLSSVHLHICLWMLEIISMFVLFVTSFCYVLPCLISMQCHRNISVHIYIVPIHIHSINIMCFHYRVIMYRACYAILY